MQEVRGWFAEGVETEIQIILRAADDWCEALSFTWSPWPPFGEFLAKSQLEVTFHNFA